MKKNIIKSVCAISLGAVALWSVGTTPSRADAPEASQMPSATASIETAMPETGSVETGTVESPNPSGSPLPSATPIVNSFKDKIPDDGFRKVVNSLVFDDKLKDDTILTETMEAEIGTYKEDLDISSKEIVNLKGIEYFTGISSLDCSHNHIELLDVSKLNKLKTLKASYNDLAEMDIAKESALEILDCSNNMLKTLDLSNASKLKELYCDNNNITTLSITHLVDLQKLHCNDNNIQGLSVDSFTKLEELYCDDNAILSLDVSKLKKLKVLENRKASIGLKLQVVGTDCGVVLPAGASKPTNISDGGTCVETNGTYAITWDKATGVPNQFTYAYVITGSKQSTTVTVNVDRTEYFANIITPSATTGLTAKSKAYNKVTLTWKGVDGASGYRVYRSVSKNSGFTKVKEIKSSDTVTYTNGGLSCGTPYYYKVRAFRLVDGNYYYGGYSSVVEGKSAPAAPSSFAATKYSTTKVKISWNKVAGASGYRIYRSKSSTTGFSKIKTITSGTKLSFTKKTARKTKYYYKARAYTTVNGKKIWGAYSKVKSKKLG